MKKRSNEEKLQLINKACDLLNESREKTQQAMKLLHLCGIEVCDNFRISDVESWENYASNVQIFSGIPKLEKITGAKGYHPTDDITEKSDKSRKLVKHKGLVFLQLANSLSSKYAYR